MSQLLYENWHCAALYFLTFCLQHNLLDDESLNDRMRGGTRYDVSENEHCDMHIVGICNVFLSLRISLRWCLRDPLFKKIFLVMVIHLNSIVSSRWIQQMNPHSFFIICLYPFLPSTSSCHPIIFWISLQKRVLLRRGGKGKINPWWPPHKKTKQTLPPSYPSFFFSVIWCGHRVTCIYIKILNRFTALQIIKSLT